MNLTTSLARSALRRAAGRARMAPSVRNAQPWLFRLGEDGLELVLDTRRTLPAQDPDGRQAVLDCGGALFNARVSLEHDGLHPVVTRFPYGSRSRVLARIEVPAEDEIPDAGPARPPIGHLEAAISLRDVDPARFVDRGISRTAIARFVKAALTEDVHLLGISRADHLAGLRALLATAQRVHGREDEGLPEDDAPRTAHGIFLIGTDDDNAHAWLRAGEATQHVLLEAAACGYAHRRIGSVLDVPATRAALRRGLGVPYHAQTLFRLGRAASTIPTARRPLSAMLVDSAAEAGEDAT